MGDTKVLLVVDDSQTIRRAVEMVFSATEYVVVAVDSAASALERAPSLSAALALVDADMPGVNGYELAEKLKADPRTAELPVLLMVADQTFDRARVDGADVDGHVTKPFRSRDLLDMVKMLTGGMVTAEGPRSFEERLDLFRLEEVARGRKSSMIEERAVAPAKVGAAPPRPASKVPRPDEGLELDFKLDAPAPKAPTAPTKKPTSSGPTRKPPPSAPPVVSEGARPPPPPDPSADLPPPAVPPSASPVPAVAPVPVAPAAPPAAPPSASILPSEADWLASSDAAVPDIAPSEKPRWKAVAVIGLVIVIVAALFMLAR